MVVLAVLRRTALVVVTGIGLGILVGGVLGRLAMFALIRLNPEHVGATSDDGFVMGQFTVSGSLNLLLAGAFLGAVGGVVYAGARHLTFGPDWWRATSVTLGAALPVGGMVVHTDGVDFTLLQPAWAAVLLFTALPASYGLLMWVVLERRLPRPPGWRRLEPLRWVLRAGATAAIAAGGVDLLRDLATLS